MKITTCNAPHKEEPKKKKYQDAVTGHQRRDSN